MSAPEVSHGRGGAGNINPDATQYTDGEIVRQGEEGPHGDGPFSTGRGGGGNIASKDEAAKERADADHIPAEATAPVHEDEDHHVGRGGAANVQLSPEHEAAKKEQKKQNRQSSTAGLADKLKGKIFGVFGKKSSSSASAPPPAAES